MDMSTEFCQSLCCGKVEGRWPDSATCDVSVPWTGYTTLCPSSQSRTRADCKTMTVKVAQDKNKIALIR